MADCAYCRPLPRIGQRHSEPADPRPPLLLPRWADDLVREREGVDAQTWYDRHLLTGSVRVVVVDGIAA